MPLSPERHKQPIKMISLMLVASAAALVLILALTLLSGEGAYLSCLLALVLVLSLYINHRIGRQLADKERGYNELLDNINGGLMVSVSDPDPDKVVVLYVSEGFSMLTGYTMNDISAMHGGSFIKMVYPEDRGIVLNGQPQEGEPDCEYSLEYRIVRRNGEVVWVLDRGRFLTDSMGARQAQGVLTDISEIKRAQGKLNHNEELLNLTFACTDNAIFEYDYSRRSYTSFMNSDKLLGKSCQQMNKALAGTSRLDEAQANDLVAKGLCYKDDFAKYRAVMQQALADGEASCVARLDSANNDYVWCKIHMLVVRGDSGEVERVVGFINNVDDFKRQADSFKRRSEKDALTGFYNKSTTVTLIDEVLTRSYEDANAMFALDIDNFKAINDTMRHVVGDAVLAEVAERMRGVFRSDDILGRVGGDEFVILARGLSGEENIIRKARDIVDAFHIMSINAGGVLNISVSIGIYRPPNCPSSYMELFLRADKALYEAKHRGKNCYVFYDPSMEEKTLGEDS